MEVTPALSRQCRARGVREAGREVANESNGKDGCALEDGGFNCGALRIVHKYCDVTDSSVPPWACALSPAPFQIGLARPPRPEPRRPRARPVPPKTGMESRIVWRRQGPR